MRKHICTDSPIRSSCLGRLAQEKKFNVTYYCEEYERNIQRVNDPWGRYMKINSWGIRQANKVMHMPAIAYNLKKYLKFVQKRAKSEVGALALFFSRKWMPLNLISEPVIAFLNKHGIVSA